MRAYELQGNGLETLAAVERPSPRPAAGQVRVRIRAASLNYRDLMIAGGSYGRAGAQRRPLVPLSDGAGEVVEVGPGVASLRPGDRVAGNFFQRWIEGPPDPEKHASALGGAIDGVLAEEVVFEAAAAVRFPAHLSFEEAATLPCAGVTAWVGLMDLARIGPGAAVLAMGTGGVSIFALQLARLAGARVILTSSSDEKLERGRALGADATVNYRREPAWDAAARAFTGGRGVDAILEVGGAATLPTELRAVRDGGHVTLVGLLGGTRADPGAASAEAAPRGIRVDSIYVGNVRALEGLCAAFARGRVRPVVDRVFPFAQAREAYRALEAGGHFGKIVIRVD
jgi:NADPH:quinone reductase-like Zn-dependent oxidoreductase